MGKAAKKKKQSQLNRKKAVEEVFKKAKKSREIAMKFDQKISKKKIQRKEKVHNKQTTDRVKDTIVDLDKKFDKIRNKDIKSLGGVASR